MIIKKRFFSFLLFLYLQTAFCYGNDFSYNRQVLPYERTNILQENCYGINWASWSNFTGNSALGTINNGGNTVNITMTSNFIFDSTPSIYNYDAKFSNYPDKIPNQTVPRTTWSIGTGGVTNMCFSEKVTNPVLLLASLGASDGTRSKLTFSVPYVVIHDGGNMEYHDSYSLTGIEGYAIIMFPGDFTCVTVNSSTYEFYTNITWGLKPPPFQIDINTIANNCNFSTVTASGGVSYKWNGGDTPNEATNTFRQNGTYIVTVTNENGCTSSASVTITLNNSSASISENSDECGKATLTATGGISYSWNGGESPNSATNVFYESGVYTVAITDISGCTTTISKNVSVKEIPIADFTMPSLICAGSSVAFSFTGNDAAITSWEWDFGNGNVSIEKNPVHTYSISGDYQVKLKVRNNAGCVSDITEKTIKVANNPEAKFVVSSPLCAGTMIQFNDESITDNEIESWQWEFEENMPLINERNPQYTFNQSGSYNVKLTIVTKEGCTQSVSQNIVIKDLPVISFNSTESYCINDAVKFKAEATGAINKWIWDFGDGNGSENTQSETEYKYNNYGSYNVTLSAISTEGCIAFSITKTVTIIQPELQVNFEILDRNNLCGNNTVRFKDLSSGVISKLEWLFQYDNEKKVSKTVLNPEKEDVYFYNYPKSGNNQNYQVVLRIYSGENCFIESQPQTLTIKATPTLVFNEISPVCINSANFLLTAHEKNQLPGTVKFEGNGIVSGNIFNLAVAGTGNHEIVSSFLSPNGCADTIRRIIRVAEIPELEGDTDFNILFGGEKQINLKILAGSDLKYRWTPSTGLSAYDVLNPVASPHETTVYTLEVSGLGDCLITKQITVKVHIDPDIPNAFSPNGDGYNDSWAVKFLETLPKANIRIFNRYGQEVFYSQQYTKPWDGRYKGQNVPTGVYYYIIEPNNGRNKYTGSITLIR